MCNHNRFVLTIQINDLRTNIGRALDCMLSKYSNSSLFANRACLSISKKMRQSLTLYLFNPSQSELIDFQLLVRLL